MMQRNLLGKTAFIVAVLLIFVYGIFGIPQKWNGEGLKDAILQHIHLGLDLKGGTHLILQVQVNDAVNADSDVTIERLKEPFSKANAAYGEISKPDSINHPEQVAIKGVPPDSAGKVHNALDSYQQEYDVTSGADNSFLLTMKTTRVNEIKQQAGTQASNTINHHLNSPDLTHPLLAHHTL